MREVSSGDKWRSDIHSSSADIPHENLQIRREKIPQNNHLFSPSQQGFYKIHEF